MRKSKIERKTKETAIKIELNVDGKGKSKIDTGIKFLNHMLELFAKHGLFDLSVKAKGDLEIDQHHTVEDIGIAIGQAFDKALAKRKGIARAGYFVMPMDESLAIVAIDIGGRPFLKFDAEFKDKIVGDLKTELIEEFFQAFANNLKVNLHVRLPYGKTTHHRTEAIFKGFARALSMACSTEKRAKGQIPSTKGKI
ncbi:imidazoleglycerol-phosphate dehydratase HisB [Candidatus Woesearchaeota archaeon]|nr:imidazoleglycerol-phosphate dehydratase HisB [Candidatus Woesearchaeota archaeon]